MTSSEANIPSKRMGTVTISERGVSLVEFVLAFPLVALLIFAIVDFARYYAVTGVLRAGAEQAVNRARKIPNFDVAYNGMNETDKGYLRFVQARDIVLNEAESIPMASLLTDQAHPSGAMLKNITSTDIGLNPATSSTPPTLTRSAAVLRPGECANLSGHGAVCNGPQGTGLPVTQLLQTYPIKVVLYADIQPFLPFLGTMTARGEAFGQRENVPQGPVAGVVTPDEAFHGSPEAPLPPVLPASGSKEVPVFVNCVPRSAANVIQQSLTTSGGAKPLAPDDQYSAAQDPFCENMNLDSSKSL